LGKGYSTAALQNKLTTIIKYSSAKDETESTNSSGFLQRDMTFQKQQEKIIKPVSKTESLLNILLSTKEQYETISTGLLKKKKKKKKKNHDF
jgi:hypothetical protein